MKNNNIPCPCCSGLEYSQCCEPFISGTTKPNTPEQLMRSRYTAYTLHDIHYIFATMRGKALQQANKAASKKWVQNTTWLGLDVLNASEVNESSTEGTVEFIATFSEANEIYKMQEFSLFHKVAGFWYYVEKLK